MSQVKCSYPFDKYISSWGDIFKWIYRSTMGLINTFHTMIHLRGEGGWRWLAEHVVSARDFPLHTSAKKRQVNLNPDQTWSSKLFCLSNFSRYPSAPRGTSNSSSCSRDIFKLKPSISPPWQQFWLHIRSECFFEMANVFHFWLECEAMSLLNTT